MTRSNETDTPVRVGYDRTDRTFRTKHEWDDSASLSSSVVHAVAVASGDDPMNVEPLYDAIDPDALDELFAPHSGSERRTDGGRLSFSYAGFRVTVYWDGKIAVVPPDAGSE